MRVAAANERGRRGQRQRHTSSVGRTSLLQGESWQNGVCKEIKQKASMKEVVEMPGVVVNIIGVIDESINRVLR